MKRNYKLICIPLIAALCGMLIFSCKKDKADTKELLVYTNNSMGSYNQISNGFIVVGQQVFGNQNVKIAASVTRPSPVEIQAKFALDTTLISSYNKANGTSYAAMPAAAYKLANGGQFTISKGNSVSDSVLLTFINPSQLTNSKGYIIPFMLQSTNGQSNLISTNRSTFFVIVSANIATFKLNTSSNATPGIVDQSLGITPAGPVFDSNAVTFAAYANINLPVSVSLNVVAKDSLVAVYNKQNKTSFISVPAGSYSIANNGAASISPGTSTSGNFEVDFDATKFTAQTASAYLLPVAIKGGDYTAGTVMYIRIMPSVVNIKPGNNLPVGTAIGRTGWKASATSSYDGLPASQVLDGDYSTYWVNDYNQGLPQSITIDMGQSNTFKGITYSTGFGFFQAYDTAPSIIVVSTSTDGINWTRQGSYSGPDSSEGAVNGISFYNPVTARYVMLNCTADYSQFGLVGFSEINAIK